MKYLLLVFFGVCSSGFAHADDSKTAAYKLCAHEAATTLLQQVKQTVGLHSLKQLVAVGEGVDVMCLKQEEPFDKSKIAQANSLMALKVAYELFPAQTLSALK